MTSPPVVPVVGQEVIVDQVITGPPIVLTGTTAPGQPGVVLPGAGQPGRGVQSATVDAAGHLILTYTDGTTQDAGDVTADLTLSPEQLAEIAEQISYVHHQTSPASVWTVSHGLGRGIVSVEVYSSDYAIQWDNVLVQPLDDDTVRLGFDDPTAGIALVL